MGKMDTTEESFATKKFEGRGYPTLMSLLAPGGAFTKDSFDQPGSNSLSQTPVRTDVLHALHFGSTPSTSALVALSKTKNLVSHGKSAKKRIFKDVNIVKCIENSMLDDHKLIQHTPVQYWANQDAGGQVQGAATTKRSTASSCAGRTWTTPW